MRVRNKFSDRVAVIAPLDDESMTQQHFKDDCNINVIMARYRKTGVITHVNRARAMYGDFSELADHAVNMDKVAKAQQAFEMLPATLRNRFENSIPGFFNFVQDPKNFDECVRMGIFDAPKQPAGTAAPASTMDAPKAASAAAPPPPTPAASAASSKAP